VPEVTYLRGKPRQQLPEIPPPAAASGSPATRETVDDPWSTPVDLGAPVDSTSAEVHPYLSAHGTELFFSSDRPGGSGGNDIWMSTREQVLPATKDDCKQDGWGAFGVFKNQGDCVSYVATGGTNSPDG